MSTIEEKFLGGNTGYCSSSDDEENETLEKDNPSPCCASTGTINTGPKGVIEDWRRFKQLETEKRETQAKELTELSKRLAFSCRTHLEDEKAKAKEAEEELIKEALADDDFLKQYMKTRMEEIQASLWNKAGKRYGIPYELLDIDAYLQAAEQDSKSCTVIIHLYEKGTVGCEAVNGCFLNLAARFVGYKFCRVQASLLGTSQKFLRSALPTIQAYRDGQLIGNFVRITDELGEDFFVDDLESFLKQYGILPDSDDSLQISNCDLNLPGIICP